MTAAQAIEVQAVTLADATIEQLEAALEAARLRKRLHEMSVPVPESGCWLWTACETDGGYGLITYRNRSIGAHRAAWIAFRSPIPKGAMVCHKCDTPQCMNPDHLFLGSPSDNARDMVRKGRNRDNSGSRHGMSKLDETKVREIRRRWMSGHTRRQIASDYGIDYRHVSYITSGKGWRHVV